MNKLIAVRNGNKWVLANSCGKIVFTGNGCGFETPQKARIAYWYYIKSKQKS